MRARQVNVCRIAKEIAVDWIRMWSGGKCGQEIFLAKAVTFTSSLLRGVSMKSFGELLCTLIATVSWGWGWGGVGADSYLRLEVAA